MNSFRQTYYIITSGRIEAVEDVKAWAIWREYADEQCRVAYDALNDIVISTVFLGIDHSASEEGEPLLYETIFIRGYDGTVERRYATREEAEAGHAELVRAVRMSEFNN